MPPLRLVLPRSISPHRSKAFGWLLVFAVGLVLRGNTVLAAEAPGAAVTTGPPANPRQLAEQAVKAIPLARGWQAIRIDEATSGRYTLTLLYARQPAGHDAVAADTKRIARALLAELVKAGQDPARNWTFVHVWAQQEGLRGET